MNEDKKIGIIGIGNLLNGDDGIGIVLIQKIRKRDLFPNISIFDAGTGGMKVLHLLKDLDRVLIIDAVHMDKKPGEYVFFSPGEVQSMEDSGGTHGSNLIQVLELSKEMGEIPEKIVIMGIQPKRTDIGEDMSEEVESRIEEMLDNLEEQVSKL